MKNLLLATLLTISAPTPKNIITFQKTYYKALTNQKSQTASPIWERTRIYDYGNIGQNDAYGLNLSMRQIEYVQTRMLTSTERIRVENYYYIEIKTNSLKFEGSALFTSITNYIPENWQSILLQVSNLTYEDGYNIYDTSTTIYSLNANSTLTEVKNKLDEINATISTTENGWQTDRSATSTSTLVHKQGVFTHMNEILNGGGYRFNYTREYNEEIAFIMHTVLIAEGQYTNTEESSYININENAVNIINWDVEENQASPTPPSPTPTPDGYEVVDLPGLMFTILGMPFAWMSTAFNLTIYPNTPYEVNFGYLFLAIVGLLIIIFIIRKLLKG